MKTSEELVKDILNDIYAVGVDAKSVIAAFNMGMARGFHFGESYRDGKWEAIARKLAGELEDKMYVADQKKSQALATYKQMEGK